jgi:uncharacterized oxidoreductase
VCSALKTDAGEIIVDRARPMRDNARPNEHALVEGFNTQLMALFGQA